MGERSPLPPEVEMEEEVGKEGRTDINFLVPKVSDEGVRAGLNERLDSGPDEGEEGEGGVKWRAERPRETGKASEFDNGAELSTLRVHEFAEANIMTKTNA